MAVIRGALSVALVLGMTGAVFADSTAAPKRAPAASSDDLSLIPVDSELVGGLDFAQLQTSPLWQKYVEPLLQTTDFVKLTAEFSAQCGMDPMKVMTKLSFGLKGLKSGTPEGVIIMHGVTKKKLAPCFEKTMKPGTTITRDGDYIFAKGAQNAAFTFLDDATLLGVLGSGATKDGIKAIAGGGSALKKSPTFVELYNKTNTSDTLWLLINGNSKLFDGAGGGALGIKPKAVYGSVNVGKDLALEGRIRVDSAAQAGTAASLLSGQTAQLGMFVDRVNVASDGADITISAALSDAKLKALLGMFGPKKRAP